MSGSLSGSLSGRLLPQETPGSSPALPAPPAPPQTKLVVKPDCLFGKRGKHDLVGLALDCAGAEDFIRQRMNKARARRGGRGGGAAAERQGAASL